jgi:hypothetical protein
VGFVVDKVALGQVSCKYFSFPCQFSFYQNASYLSIIWQVSCKYFSFPCQFSFYQNASYLSSGAGTIDQLVTYIASGLSLTPPHKTEKLKYCRIIK